MRGASSRGDTLGLLSVTVVGLILITLSGCTAVSANRRLERADRDIADLKRERDRLESLLAECEGHQESMSNEIRRLKADLAQLQDENVTLRSAAYRDRQPSPPPESEAETEKSLREIEGVSVDRTAGGDLRITLDQAILFPPGSADVSKAGADSLRRIGTIIKNRYPDRAVRVEGHTDSTPVQKVKKKYPSNWELSSARASAVLRALMVEGAVSASRSYVAGYADQRPVGNNATDEGRRANRRVEVTILP